MLWKTTLAVCVSVGGMVACADAATLETIFNLARDRDSTRLLAIAKAASENTLQRRAAELGLYMADPCLYAERFVAIFPEDPTGVMHQLYEQIELQKLTPEFLFSFKSLGMIARAGSVTASRKLFAALRSSDGAVSEQLCEEAIRLIEESPATAVRGLAKFDDGSKIALCFDLLNADEKTKLSEALSGAGPFTVVEEDVVKRLNRELTRSSKR